MKNYDIIVIGAGAGLEIVAKALSDLIPDTLSNLK